MTEIEKKRSDLQNLLRLTENTINLLHDGSFNGNLCLVIGESLNWLKAIQNDINVQIKALEPVNTVNEVKVPNTTETGLESNSRPISDESKVSS